MDMFVRLNGPPLSQSKKFIKKSVDVLGKSFVTSKSAKFNFRGTSLVIEKLLNKKYRLPETTI